MCERTLTSLFVISESHVTKIIFAYENSDVKRFVKNLPQVGVIQLGTVNNYFAKLWDDNLLLMFNIALSEARSGVTDITIDKF